MKLEIEPNMLNARILCQHKIYQLYSAVLCLCVYKDWCAQRAGRSAAKPTCVVKKRYFICMTAQDNFSIFSSRKNTEKIGQI